MGEEKKKKLKKGTLYLVRTAVIAALYFVLTIIAAPIAYGPLQFRIGEALTLLPIIFPSAVPGLTLGCFLANIFSPYAWADMVFGTLATLSASLLTSAIGNALREKSLIIRGLVGAIPPIIINAFALPLIWVLLEVDLAYWINFGQIIATQTGTILVVGLPLMLAIARTPLVDEKVRLHKGKKIAKVDQEAELNEE
ncbi:MAG TPA: QueT transporter family protein [Clostridia bacterium]|jgi:uncharacterized membrane protein|nr:QueT transporter family protein [Clostridia bacterium]